jgi:hypothetical protein
MGLSHPKSESQGRVRSCNNPLTRIVTGTDQVPSQGDSIISHEAFL